jgi:hypothetical protein
LKGGRKDARKVSHRSAMLRALAEQTSSFRPSVSGVGELKS